MVTAVTLPLRLSPNNPLTVEVEYLANDPNGDQADLVAYTSESLVVSLYIQKRREPAVELA